MPRSSKRRGAPPAAQEVFREFAWRLAGALSAVKQQGQRPRTGVAEPRAGIARLRRVR